MKVKIFQAVGAREIAAMEQDINGWLAVLEGTGAVNHTSTAMCTISDGGEAESYQGAMITVWYDD